MTMNDRDTKTHVLELNSNLSDSEIDCDNSSDGVHKDKPASVKPNFESSDEECAPVSRVKKRLQCFTDSDSDADTEDVQQNKLSEGENETKNKISSTSEQSDSKDDSDSDNKKSNKNEEQQLRMKNKRNKLRQKFKSLVTSRSKEVSKVLLDSDQEQNQCKSDDSMDEETFLNNDQEINKSMPFKSSIYDPDTSDEENIDNKKQKLVSKLQQRKTTKPVSPKPLRMSAKQAMENMQKIRSESNRLLREKEISLPYHRPKAFSLKDIMSRRKPAISADGKALPIKMNEEQLKQYAQMLEQRQKEIMDLCKSESDEEQDNCDAVNNQKEPLDLKENDIASASLENNEDNSTNVLGAESTSVKETLLQEETKLSNMDDFYINTELDNSSKMEVDTQCSSEDNLLAINNDLSKENVETDGLTKNAISEEKKTTHLNVTDKSANENVTKISTEPESQIINLHYDSENTYNDKCIHGNNSGTHKKDEFELQDNDFSDDIDMDYIDQLIENADITKDQTYEDTAKSSTLSTTAVPLDIKPKLTGVPGMVIDLDSSESVTCKKMSGVELLKERFSYFAKLKTPDELEREKEKKLKPGVQHLKLKQQLEDIIAEQRSLEWAKRLNEEKQQQIEFKALRGEESDSEDDIEKIEALIDEKDVAHEETSEGGESEPEEDDLGDIKEKPRKKHTMIDDEAEESDCEDEDIEEKQTEINKEENDASNVHEEDDTSGEEASSDEYSDDESEDEEETKKVKKGRILKAFEDSDDETTNGTEKKTDNIKDKVNNVQPINAKDKIITDKNEEKEVTDKDDMEPECEVGSQMHKQSQDDEIQLAQRMESASDIFGSPESASMVFRTNSQGDDYENALGTQTFSILKSTKDNDVLCNLENPQKLSFTQTLDSNLDAAAANCSGSFTENLIPSNLISSQPPIEQSQPIGEDVLALCTGNFYDNQFISQSGENKESEIQESVNDNFDDSWSKTNSQESETDTFIDSSKKLKEKEQKNNGNIVYNGEIKDKDQPIVKPQQRAEDQNLLQSIIDELNDDAKIDSLKPNKYFASKDPNNDANDKFKKKFVIESDDELNVDITEQKKKVKKKNLEQRALQISDDEEEDSYNEEDVEQENDAERIIEYDSEENEIEVQQQNPKKKRKAIDFFENEAELTSEDEWVGSGDEDEAGLDRMEREEGDDEIFHQGKLQRELGQIHMRDQLDQDKREVRLIQELLFEDGDLGGGSRQRKFRWRNADGEEGPDTIVDDFADTQEEEFESEEQWRKQRHERETFLRQMEEQDKTEDSPNRTISRTSIIKANLTSKSISSLLLEVNDTTIKKTDKIENSIIKEKTVKDMPNTINGFTILQQNYHSSLLTRGRGALARLAALATPLAVDDDSTKVATVAPKNQRNFVFAAITKEDREPKATKRKADSKLDTPRLVKKLKTNEKQTLTRNSLLDHLKI